MSSLSPTPGRPDRALIALGALVFTTTVGAVLWLETRGLETAVLISIVGPVVTALLVGQHLAHSTTTSAKIQSEKLDAITEQTNGALTEKIHDDVLATFDAKIPELVDLIIDRLHQDQAEHYTGRRRTEVPDYDNLEDDETPPF